MRISIVTPTLNRRDYLIRTGHSILSQTGPFELEWLIMDGGSNDGTVAYLADLAKSDPRVRYVSQADRGQSDAINKGLAAATGDIVAWLNADLALWAKQLASGKPQDRATVQQTLSHWQKDTDLAGIREPAALAKLPAAEQAACKKLWADVAALLKKAADKT